MSISTSSDIARLYARAAFGARPADLDAWTGEPYEDAVDHLLDLPPVMPPLPDDVRRVLLERAGRAELAEQLRTIDRRLGAAVAPNEGQRWWLERMRTSPWPLLERVTLFWHDHFATAFGGPYPDLSMLLVQNQTIRRNALGSFRTMVEELTIDPAMLYWLNGAQNAKGKPNENFARELFELFSLGTIPQVYAEGDIREAARALTGWVVDLENRTALFQEGRHDTRNKRVLGRTIGNLGADEYREVIDVALAQPVASRFIAYKLVQGFAYPPASTDDSLVVEVATALAGSGFDLRAGVRALLVSDAFRYAPAIQRKQTVRQPIDVLVASARATGVGLDDTNYLGLLQRLGQVPFEPPNVGGWPFGPSWLNPVTTLARYDLGATIGYAAAELRQLQGVVGFPPSGDLDGWTRLFGLAELSGNTRSVLTGYLASRAAASEGERQVGMLILLASSPDWMVI